MNAFNPSETSDSRHLISSSMNLARNSRTEQILNKNRAINGNSDPTCQYHVARDHKSDITSQIVASSVATTANTSQNMKTRLVSRGICDDDTNRHILGLSRGKSFGSTWSWVTACLLLGLPAVVQPSYSGRI